jgi:S1-C subfamily serine protease
MARNVMKALIEDGEVRRGRLGITVQPVTSDVAEGLELPEIAGALVNSVERGSPADRAGLKAGDVITAINGTGVTSSNELRNRIAHLGPDAKVDLTIVRDGQSQTVSATLEELTTASAAPTRRR